MSSSCLWKLSASFQFFQYKFFARFAGYSCCIEDNIRGNVYKSIVDVRLFMSWDLGGVLDERTNFAPNFVHLKVLSCWSLVCFSSGNHLFLVLLRDTIGGNENTWLVSGSFCMILKVLRMMVFTVEVYGW